MASNQDQAVSRLTSMLREWDSGAKSVRRKILQDFIALNLNKNAVQLDEEYADAASLFLTRVCAWLRLTYLIGTCLSEQLQVLQIYLSATNGHKFLQEFLEIGGLLTVIEILGVKQAREGDKGEAVLLLTCIASNGRKYKELICESYGIRATAECLARCRSEATQEKCRYLLQALAEGNPKFETQVYKGLIALLPCSSPKAQQMAAQTLRIVQPIVKESHTAIVQPVLNLLKSLHPEVQYEGIELIKLLMEYSVRTSILEGLVKLLRPTRELILKYSNPIEDSEIDKLSPPLPVFIQQAAAAKCIRLLSSNSSSTAEEFLKLPVLGNLMFCVGNDEHIESQRQASMTLEFFCHTYPKVADTIELAIGETLYDLLMEDAEALYNKLTSVQCDVFLTNKMTKESASATESL